MDLDDVVLVGVDSSEPDLNDGQVGREHYGFIEEAFSDARDKLKVFVVHHHLIPLPGTGRERNIIFDAGDVLEGLWRRGWISCSRGTSTCRTPGGWRTC